MKFDYLIVGAGLFGATFANLANKDGKKVLVIDKRNNVAGNGYTEEQEGINVHKYGTHIFRTSRRDIWDYIRQFADFNHFVNSPIANYHGKIYNMPFNMNTFNRIWGVTTPAEAMAKIEEQRKEIKDEPRNLEEKAISLVGRDVYEILIREYTEKQWGRPCSELPVSIMRRLPVRLIYDNNYFNDPYQGIPIGGYTAIFEKMLAIAFFFVLDFVKKSYNEMLRISNSIFPLGAVTSAISPTFFPSNPLAIGVVTESFFSFKLASLSDTMVYSIS